MRLFLLLCIGLIPSVVQAGYTEEIELLRKSPTDSSVARPAWDRLITSGPEALIPILRAWPKDDPVAINWLRTAFDQIADHHAEQLPVDALLDFAREVTAPGKARRLALGRVEKLRPGTTTKLLPTWLNDPEFGPDAVAERIEASEKATDPTEAIKILQTAFEASTEIEQVQQLGRKLNASGAKVNPLKQLGVLTSWRVIGPFPVSPEEGLKQSFPPEKQIDLKATFEGKSGPLTWKEASSDPLDGKLDLAKQGIKLEDGSVAYSMTKIRLKHALPGELRVSAVDNVTVWLNGKKVIERSNDYRSLYRQDRYRAAIQIPEGESTLLLKLTKTRPDEGQQAAAQKGGKQLSTRWDFQVRLLDPQGRGLSIETEGKK